MIWSTIKRSLKQGVAQPLGEPAEPAMMENATPVGQSVEIEFAAYGDGCRVFGFLGLIAARLSDQLNDLESVELTDVLAVNLEDGRATQAGTLIVRRDELLAVRASGPRGNLARRRRSRPYPVTLQTGPYLIHGYLHGIPGADPITQLRRRKTMVPLTESWIEYVAEGTTRRARVGGIIVNRELMDWIRLSRDEEVHLPDLPAEISPDPRAKDMTGHIFVGRH